MNHSYIIALISDILTNIQFKRAMLAIALFNLKIYVKDRKNYT